MYLYYSGLEGQVLDQIELIHGSTAQLHKSQRIKCSPTVQQQVHLGPGRLGEKIQKGKWSQRGRNTRTKPEKFFGANLKEHFGQSMII